MDPPAWDMKKTLPNQIKEKPLEEIQEPCYNTGVQQKFVWCAFIQIGYLTWRLYRLFPPYPPAMGLLRMQQPLFTV